MICFHCLIIVSSENNAWAFCFDWCPKDSISEAVKPAEPVSAPVDDIEPTPIVHEDDEDFEPEPKTPFMEKGNLGINQVKEAALRELAPILSKLDVPAEQKFDIYKNVIDNYHDSSVIEPAYYAASKIKDEKDRGEALLYLIDSIDKM